MNELNLIGWELNSHRAPEGCAIIARLNAGSLKLARYLDAPGGTREESLAMIAAREKKRENENVSKIRAYGKLRDIVEARGGSMIYQRQGYRHGAWEILLDGKTVIIESTGMENLPVLDQFYRPRCTNPRTWIDYDDALVPPGEGKLLGMV